MAGEFVAVVFDAAVAVDCCALSQAVRIKAVVAANEMASTSDEKRRKASLKKGCILFIIDTLCYW
jgi:hypothetical protein